MRQVSVDLWVVGIGRLLGVCDRIMLPRIHTSLRHVFIRLLSKRCLALAGCRYSQMCSGPQFVCRGLVRSLVSLGRYCCLELACSLLRIGIAFCKVSGRKEYQRRVVRSLAHVRCTLEVQTLKTTDLSYYRRFWAFALYNQAYVLGTGALFRVRVRKRHMFLKVDIVPNSLVCRYPTGQAVTVRLPYAGKDMSPIRYHFCTRR